MGNFFSDLFGGGSKDSTIQTSNDWQMAPEYSEAVGARGNWYDTLNQWGSMPGYGAVQPDWDEIWNNAKQKVTEFYRGGTAGPGQDARVKSNLAERGMSENPSAEGVLGRLSQAEGNSLMDIAVKQATQKAELGEKGRTNWLQSMQSLAGLKPQMLNYGSTMDTSTQPLSPAAKIGFGFGDTIGGETGSGGDLKDTISQFANMFGLGDIFGGGESNLGATGNAGKDDGFGFEEGADIAMKAIPMLVQMFCWVAAELFDGWDDPRTHQTRYFILNVGPKWFKNFYGKHGEKIASYIHDKPILKLLTLPLFQAFSFIGKTAMKIDNATFPVMA